MARLVRFSSFGAPVLAEAVEKHLHLVMAMKQRRKVLDKVLLAKCRRKTDEPIFFSERQGI
jgi:hypothetical protein